MKKFLSVLLALTMLLSLSVTAFAAEEKLNFLSLGDSIAAGAGLVAPNRQTYGAIVSNTNGYNFKNDAISGHTTQAMFKRINEPKVAEDIKNADIICISIGGNNFLMNNLPGLINDALEKNDYTKFDEIADTYYNELGKIFTYIRELNGEATLILQTLYNPMFADDSLRMVYQEGADRLNTTMTKFLADNEGLYTLVDVGAAFTNYGDEIIAADYIHPNSQGHIAIAREVLKTLKELGLGEETEPVYKEIQVQTMFDNLIKRLREMIASLQNLFKSIFG